MNITEADTSYIVHLLRAYIYGKLLERTIYGIADIEPGFFMEDTFLHIRHGIYFEFW